MRPGAACLVLIRVGAEGAPVRTLRKLQLAFEGLKLQVTFREHVVRVLLSTAEPKVPRLKLGFSGSRRVGARHQATLEEANHLTTIEARLYCEAPDGSDRRHIVSLPRIKLRSAEEEHRNAQREHDAPHGRARYLCAAARACLCPIRQQRRQFVARLAAWPTLREQRLSRRPFQSPKRAQLLRRTCAEPLAWHHALRFRRAAAAGHRSVLLCGFAANCPAAGAVQAAPARCGGQQAAGGS